MTRDPTTEPRHTRVLLVDDEKELVISLSKRLKRQGLSIVGTSSGGEALAAAKRSTFDVAVIDLALPGMSGLEVLKELKALQPTLQAIILTGTGSVQDALHSGRLDALSYLRKPADFEQLVKLIHAGHTERRRILWHAFDHELRRITSTHLSALEIMHAATQLRQKYEQ